MSFVARKYAGAAAEARRPAFWRVAVWLVAMFAAIGIVQYISHALQINAAMHAIPPASDQDAALLRAMLAWDMAYLAGAVLVLVAAVGAILRRNWGRKAMRVVAIALLLWAVFTAWNMLMHWGDIQRAGEALLAQTGEDQRAAVEHARMIYGTGIALKLVSIPLFGWLAWRLGHPVVRCQFLRKH
jgi:hypothetical protein